MARILVIDDDPDFLNLVKLYLTGQDHEVLTSKDAYEATELLDKYKMDLALVDVNMPFASGFEFVKTLKRTLRHRFLPVVFVTARNSKTDVAKAIDLEADGYIIKPIIKDDFLKKVEDFLKKVKPTQALNVEIDKTSQAYEGEMSVSFPVKVVSVSEMGLVLDCPRKLEDDDIVDVKSYLYTLMEVSPVQLKLLTQKLNETTKMWRSHFIFHQVNQETLQKIQMFLQSTVRTGKPIK